MEIIIVKDIFEGIDEAKEILYQKVDKKTVLFLSGGKTPRTLYETLAMEEKIKPVAAGLIDERFGESMHKNSNELMLKQSGLLYYLEKKNIPFYSMLSQNRPDQTTSTLGFHPKGGLALHPRNELDGLTSQYDQTVRDLLFKFPKSLGIIGIGEDGHIASIFPNRGDFKNPIFDSKTYDYVTSVNHPGKYGKRVTLTFEALSLLDFYLIFVFGKEKKNALKKSLAEGSLEIPARFFLRSEISKKTLFITDQKI